MRIYFLSLLQKSALLPLGKRALFAELSTYSTTASAHASLSVCSGKPTVTRKKFRK